MDFIEGSPFIYIAAGWNKWAAKCEQISCFSHVLWQ